MHSCKNQKTSKWLTGVLLFGACKIYTNGVSVDQIYTGVTTVHLVKAIHKSSFADVCVIGKQF